MKIKEKGASRFSPQVTQQCQGIGHFPRSLSRNRAKRVSTSKDFLSSLHLDFSYKDHLLLFASPEYLDVF